MAQLTYKDTKRQSEAVFAQFGNTVWLDNAKRNAEIPSRDAMELRNIGIGKTLVLVALGPSLEKNIHLLKENRHKIDIACCDKAFSVLMDNGIKADYVSLADANIEYRWIEKHIANTVGVKLFAGAYANPKWIENWKGDIYFYCNEDSIDTNKIYKPIIEKNGNKTRLIPAGSNVSNAMLCFINGSNNQGLQNFMGYDKYILVGYDFSWYPDSNYYAFHNPKPKRYYMHHRTILDYANKICYTSENLLFSARWLFQYIKAFNINAVNCSEAGILDIPKRNNLKNELDNIVSDEGKIRNTKECFKTMQMCHAAFEQAKHNFIVAQEINYAR